MANVTTSGKTEANTMGNLDEDTKRYDREARAGAKQYDEEVNKWWQLDQEDDEPDETED